MSSLRHQASPAIQLTGRRWTRWKQINMIVRAKATDQVRPVATSGPLGALQIVVDDLERQLITMNLHNKLGINHSLCILLAEAARRSTVVSELAPGQSNQRPRPGELPSTTLTGCLERRVGFCARDTKPLAANKDSFSLQRYDRDGNIGAQQAVIGRLYRAFNRK